MNNASFELIKRRPLILIVLEKEADAPGATMKLEVSVIPRVKRLAGTSWHPIGGLEE